MFETSSEADITYANVAHSLGECYKATQRIEEAADLLAMALNLRE